MEHNNTRNFFTILCWIAETLVAVYLVLFAIFYFDIDSKVIYRRIMPRLNAHYDAMRHKDITKNPYKMHIGKEEPT
jgi:hypothetical protein